ncbi:unnamed protein product [Arabis nemorensis]|uniref:Uncharacterized protein n=1 Tax=Arabis nemorensis TaxID=586526 RepID=A0A565B9T1_9BRAS|nr:unnamed protein product [Arabis nemorensis]
MEATVSFGGGMFKLISDNYSYWKPMMEDHLYCHETIIKNKMEEKDDKASKLLN